MRKFKNYIIMLICFLSIGLLLKGSVVFANSYYSETGAPIFYGMTKAIIQKDTSFDLTDAHLRIFARDFEDGDLTDKIVIVSNNVNTSQIGDYEVVYKVTDSHKNVAQITVPISVVDNNDGSYYERTIYTLPNVNHMGVTGPRGNSMDRQITGLMLNPNATIRMKMISGPSAYAQRFNGSGNYKDYKLTKEYQNITLDTVSTILIGTPYNVSDKVVVAINVPEGEDVVEVPYYHYKDNEDAFRTYWNSFTQGTSVGVIENQSVMFYLTVFDKDNFKNFGTLDKGLEVFDQIMTEYDELLGYEYNAKDPWNQNVKTKYFIKGAGANNGALAYYSTGMVVWAGSQTPTGNAFSLGWATLHEIAHGYQGGGLKEDGGMALTEVSNNILGYYVQTKSSLKPLFNGANWLGNIADIENAINNKRLNGTTFRGLGPKEKLYVLVNLLDMNGNYKEAYMTLARLTRELSYKGELNNYSLADRYTLTLYELYGVNVASYFESWGEKISPKVKEKIKNGKTASMLKDVISDETLITQIKNDLGINNYSLVTPDMLDKYKLTSDVKIHINIDDINNLLDKELVFSNGNVNKKFKISGKDINITLPIGDYNLFLPVPKENIYEYDKNKLIKITNNTVNEYTLDYSASHKATLANDTVISLSGQVGEFARLTFDKDNIYVNCTGAFTHVSFGGMAYGRIQIYDLNNKIVFDKSYMGNVYTSRSADIIPYKLGYKIVVTHLEGQSTRYTLKHSITGENINYLTKVKGDNTYYIGAYGLYQTVESYDNFKNRIDNYAEEIIEKINKEQTFNKESFSEEKRILLLSIMDLKEEDKEIYLQKYLTLYNGNAPKLSNNEITVSSLENINFYQLLKGIDDEDDEFTLNEGNATFSNIMKNGDTYYVNYSLIDKDKNISKGTLTIILNELVVPDKPSDKPAGDITKPNDNTDKPNSETSNKPSENIPVNPNTSDNILLYVGLGIILILAVCIIIIKLNHLNKRNR